MKHRILLAGLTAALLLPVAAFSETAPPIVARETAKPEEIAAARRQADAIIAASGRAELFENASSSSKLPTIRHRPSNITCHFDPAAKVNEIVVKADGAVSCKSVAPGSLTEQVITALNPALPAPRRAKLKAAAYNQFLVSPVIGTFKPISDKIPPADAYGIRGIRIEKADTLVLAWVGAVDAAGWAVTLELILMTDEDTPQHTADALQVMSRLRGEVSLMVSSKEAKPASAGS